MAMVGRIMVIGVLTCCALLSSMCDFKIAQMKLQCRLFPGLYKFKLSHATEITKNIVHKWKHNWSQYSKQMVQEPQWSGLKLDSKVLS